MSTDIQRKRLADTFLASTLKMYIIPEGIVLLDHRVTKSLQNVYVSLKTHTFLHIKQKWPPMILKKASAINKEE